VNPNDVEYNVPDVENDEYNWTDGCGELGEEIAEKIAEKLQLNSTPSVFQV
jgi:hypothetical protein